MARGLLASAEAVSLAHLGEDLGLHARDVHLGGTLALARFAPYAEVHDLPHVFARELLWRERAVHHGAEHVGAGPRGVLLVEGDHVRGAHRAAGLLAAEPASVAELDGGGEVPLTGEIQVRVYGEAPAARSDAQLAVHRRGIHDHTGVHHAFRVEEPLDFREGAQDLGPVHLLEELGAGEAVAVLAGERASAVHDEIGDLPCDAPHPGRPRGIGGVERWPDVQTPDARVAVEAGPGSVLLDDLLEAPYELLEPLRRHGRVLHEGDGLLLLGRAEQERQDGLAELDRRLHLTLRAQRRRVERPDLSGYLLEPGEPRV